MDTFIPLHCALALYTIYMYIAHVHNTTCTCMLYIITLNELI